MLDNLRAGFAYWLVTLAERIYPPLIAEIVHMTCKAIVKDAEPNESLEHQENKANPDVWDLIAFHTGCVTTLPPS